MQAPYQDCSNAGSNGIWNSAAVEKGKTAGCKNASKQFPKRLRPVCIDLLKFISQLRSRNRMAAEATAQVIELLQLGEIIPPTFMNAPCLRPCAISGKLHSNNNAGRDDKNIHMGSTTGIAHPVQGVLHPENFCAAV